MPRTESVASKLPASTLGWLNGETAAWTPREFFAKHGKPLEVRRHKPVYLAGEPAHQLFWICWGEVALVRNAVDGHDFTVDNGRQGTVFGEQEMLLDIVRQSSAWCRTDVALFCLPRGPAQALRDQVPEFAWWLNRILATRLVRMQDRAESLLFKSAYGKVAQALVDLVQNHGRETGEGILIDDAITHVEIGSLIGCARETVSCAFIEFRDLGLIATRNRRTIVRDLGRLRQVAAQ